MAKKDDNYNDRKSLVDQFKTPKKRADFKSKMLRKPKIKNYSK